MDKTGTFKVPRGSASAARSLPPEPPPDATPCSGDVNGSRETTGEETGLGDTPASALNGTGVQSDSMNNTFCHGDRFDEVRPEMEAKWAQRLQCELRVTCFVVLVLFLFL